VQIVEAEGSISISSQDENLNSLKSRVCRLFGCRKELPKSKPVDPQSRFGCKRFATRVAVVDLCRAGKEKHTKGISRISQRVSSLGFREEIRDFQGQ